MKLRVFILFLFFCINVFPQTTFTTNPKYPTQTDTITITFDVTNATHVNKIAGYTGDVYAHTGVTLQTGNGTPIRWQNVIGSWGNNNVQPKLTRTGANTYLITIRNPRNYYNVTDPNTKITELCFVLRSSDGSKQTEDIFVPLYEPGIFIVINSPKVNTNFEDPARSPVFVNENGTIPISITTSEIGTKTKSINLFVNNVQKAQSQTNSLTFDFVANNYPAWKNEIKIVAEDTAGIKDSAEFAVFKNVTPAEEPLPTGNEIGINYGSDPTKVTLALYAPYKKNIFVIGDFNDWKVDTTYYMKRYEVTPDSVIWWITISNLTPKQEYGYQFLIDGSLRIPDPYTEKVLDAANDPEIPASVYPNLKPYPNGKTDQLVSVFQTGQTPYQWKAQNYKRPAKEKLVIYELLMRDFISTHWYKTLQDTLSYFKNLGINAIELMPVAEFERNDSWGYNPSMYFAPDKYYGTKDQLKEFIDACHQNGIAVIMDIVLNHAYGSNPMVRMYWDTTNGRPAANNPWFNQVAPHQCFSWGYDFNHESNATKYFVDRVTSFWLTEYKMDGFRFDFTKGFTNTPTNSSNGCGSYKDNSRIAILERMADKIWTVDSTAYVILEHFAEDSEERELSNHGMMLWGNLNGSYQQSAMGYPSGPPGTWDFTRISYKSRGWTKPLLVGYMESHDEERLMYKNLQYGNSSGSYNIKDLNTALNRIKLCATFFITVPGPKMIWEFGELGYDYSIDYNGRLGRKPIPWDSPLNYLNNGNRKNLYKVFKALINLKENYQAFSSGNFSINASGQLKKISITDPSMDITILGNFGVTTGNITPYFQKRGMWYEYFLGDSLNVTDTLAQISLQPGEYRIYTSVKIPPAPPGITTEVNEKYIPEIPSEYKLEQNYPNPFNPSTTIIYTIPQNPYSPPSQSPTRSADTEVGRATSGDLYQRGKTGRFVSLKVYDILGKEVATLVNEEKSPGIYEVKFDGSKLASGVYFYSLKVNGSSPGASLNSASGSEFISTKKMILLK